MIRDSEKLTAAELMEQLRRDPAYVASQAARDAEVERQDAEFAAAEAPIVDDLRRAGVDVSSVWDVVNTDEPYPEAPPIVLEHLAKGAIPTGSWPGSLGRSRSRPRVRGGASSVSCSSMPVAPRSEMAWPPRWPAPPRPTMSTP